MPRLRLDRISSTRKQINVVVTATVFAQLETLSHGSTKTDTIAKLISDEFERRNRRDEDRPQPGSAGTAATDGGRPRPDAGGSSGDHARVDAAAHPAAVDELDTIA